MKKPSYSHPAVTEEEALRLGEELVAQHGERAEMVAAMNVDKFERRQNQETVVLWLRILAVIRQLRKTSGPMN